MSVCYIPEGGALVETCTRTMQGRLLLRSGAEENDLMLGAVGRAMEYALATGQTLWALERAGINPTEDAVVRARRYLLDTQGDDGSWTVHTTLSSEHGPMPTSNYWGTGWAVVGLLRSLPKT